MRFDLHCSAPRKALCYHRVCPESLRLDLRPFNPELTVKVLDTAESQSLELGTNDRTEDVGYRLRDRVGVETGLNDLPVTSP
jgi:hypothetical protein